MSDANIVHLALVGLVVCCCFNFSFPLKNKDKPCKQITTCKCIFPTGRGINLLPVNNMLSVPVRSNESIFIHLCDDVSFGKNDSANQCFHNVSVCFVNDSTNTSLSLGKAEDMVFKTDSEFRPKSLQFNHNEKQTIIALVCSEEAAEPRLTLTSTEDNVFLCIIGDGLLCCFFINYMIHWYIKTGKYYLTGKHENSRTFEFISAQLAYCGGRYSSMLLLLISYSFLLGKIPIKNLQLESKHTCVHTFSVEELMPVGGLSTGSVLVIMFMVFTLVYFGGGMLTLKLLRGAEGKEMIPNIDFWTDLPYLVRDGILFAFNGFQPASTYDRI